MIVIRKRFSDVRIYETEISPTLEADMGTGGGNQPIILEVHDEAEDKEGRCERADQNSLRIPVP